MQYPVLYQRNCRLVFRVYVANPQCSLHSAQEAAPFGRAHATCETFLSV